MWRGGRRHISDALRRVLSSLILMWIMMTYRSMVKKFFIVLCIHLVFWYVYIGQAFFYYKKEVYKNDKLKLCDQRSFLNTRVRLCANEPFVRWIYTELSCRRHFVKLFFNWTVFHFHWSIKPTTLTTTKMMQEDISWDATSHRLFLSITTLSGTTIL